MEIAAFRKEFPADGMRRHNDFCFIVNLHEMLQSSSMVAMSVGDKHIVHRTEVDTHLLGITDKDIACSCVHQNPMMVCFK